MTDAAVLMTVAEAEAVIDAEAVEVRTEEIDLWDAVGFGYARLAADVAADRDYPPFDKALMDGYAVGEGAGPWRVVGEVRAGSTDAGRLAPGEAVAIMTGAPVPGGTAAVLPVEHAREADGRVGVDPPDRTIPPGQAIARRGSDRRAGEIVLRAGRRFGAPESAVLATVGLPRLRVTRPALVAILTTGDELVAPRKTPGPLQIRDASADMLDELAGRLAHSFHNIDHARLPDDAAHISAAVREDFTVADVLLLTGGMSMGRHDHVPQVLRDLGCEFRISKVAMKPGKPFVFAVLPKEKSEDGRPRYVFGLPGNPVSAFVCTLRLASRLIARLGGGPADEFTRTRPGVLAEPLPANGPREFYQPCHFDGPTVVPLRWRGSADVFTLAAADALIVRPAADPPRVVGAPVEVLEIPR